jgi:hypothetical protein
MPIGAVWVLLQMNLCAKQKGPARVERTKDQVISTVPKQPSPLPLLHSTDGEELDQLLHSGVDSKHQDNDPT